MSILLVGTDLPDSCERKVQGSRELRVIQMTQVRGPLSAKIVISGADFRDLPGNTIAILNKWGQLLEQSFVAQQASTSMRGHSPSVVWVGCNQLMISDAQRTVPFGGLGATVGPGVNPGLAL